MSQTHDSDPATVRGQVLEFDLGAETYCVSIEYITEIVNAGDVTGVPNAAHHVEGVMDLRGNTTTIIDPKKLLDIDPSEAPQRIIVFDPDVFDEDRTIGWLVDEAHEVTTVANEVVDDSPTDDDCVRGIIKRDESQNGDQEFVVWLDPHTLHA